MRAREFLVEFNLQKTIDNYGPKILEAWNMFNSGAFKSDFYKTALSIKKANTIKQQLKIGLTPIDYRGQKFILDKPITNIPQGFDLNEFLEIIDRNKNVLITGVIEYILGRDPTPNKQYTPWLLRSWLNGRGTVALDELNDYNLLDYFHEAKQRGLIKRQDRDVNQFGTYRDFESMMFKYDTLLSDLESRKIIDRGDYEEIYSGSDARIIQVKDFKASDYYGRGTIWCTAGKSPDAARHFSNYIGKGPLYIIIPKSPQYVGEKYQLHSATGEFTKEDNIRLPLADLKERFPEASKFLYNEVPGFKFAAELADVDLIRGLWKASAGANLEYLRDKHPDVVDKTLQETIEWLISKNFYEIIYYIVDFGKLENKFTKVYEISDVFTYKLTSMMSSIYRFEDELYENIRIVGNGVGSYVIPYKTVGSWTLGFAP